MGEVLRVMLSRHHPVNRQGMLNVVPRSDVDREAARSSSGVRKQADSFLEFCISWRCCSNEELFEGRVEPLSFADFFIDFCKRKLCVSTMELALDADVAAYPIALSIVIDAMLPLTLSTVAESIGVLPLPSQKVPHQILEVVPGPWDLPFTHRW